MRPRSASFVTSASSPAEFPPSTLPEIAFAGRSNVGKSSLINTITDVAGLARTSRTPGRTRLLNWFRVEPQKGSALHFVDLPGYGYADVPLAMRDAWRPLIEAVLTDRPKLRAVALLIDARRGIEEEELDFVPWLGEKQIPIIAVLTKSDKLGKAQRKPAAMEVRRALGMQRDPILFSATERAGVDELWRAIFSILSERPA
jgi:GTP-binding protein